MMMTSSLRHVLEEEGTAVNLAAVLNAGRSWRRSECHLQCCLKCNITF